MKRVTFPAMLLVLALLLTACAAGQKSFQRGSVEGQTYTSDFLGLTCTAPETYSYLSDEEIAALNDIALDSMTDEALVAEMRQRLEAGSQVQDMYLMTEDGRQWISITVDKVTVQTYADQASLMMALASGECDAYYNYASPIEATLIDSFTGMDGLDMGESPFAGSYQMLFGCSRTPGDDVNFRQAIAYAIDYPTAATAINGEYGKPANRGVLGPSFKGFDDSIAMLEYNAETAKSMLDAAGYVDADGDGWRELPDGGKMDLSVIPQYSRSMEVRSRLGEIICKSLQNVGVNCHIDEEAIANSEIWEDKVTKEEYDISITFTTSGMLYSTPFRYMLAELRDGDSGWHWGSCHDPRLKEYYYAMTEAINDEQYIENSRNLQHLADEEMFGLTFAWQTGFFPYRTDKIEGWDNWQSWGVINARTWFDLTAK